MARRCARWALAILLATTAGVSAAPAAGRNVLDGSTDTANNLDRRNPDSASPPGRGTGFIGVKDDKKAGQMIDVPDFFKLARRSSESKPPPRGFVGVPIGKDGKIGHKITRDVNANENSEIVESKPPRDFVGVPIGKDGKIGHKTTRDVNSKPKVVERDVCIIGAGPSGSFAALRLKEHGQTVVIVEESNSLDGVFKHYTTTEFTNAVDSTEAGYYNIPTVLELFSGLDLPVQNNKPSNNWNSIDFTTGNAVNQSSASIDQGAIEKYRSVLSQYSSISHGFESLSDLIPDELVKPFGDFVETHSLQGIVHAATHFTRGMSNILEQPTIYVLKAFNVHALDSLKNGFIVAQDGNGAMYDAILAKVLKDDHDQDESVLFNSALKSVHRSNSGVNVTVTTHSGVVNIVAKKLLIAKPVDADKIKLYDFDDTESFLQGRLHSGGGGIASAVVRSPISNLKKAFDNASPDTKFNIPLLPNSYEAIPSTNYLVVRYGFGDGEPQTDDEIKGRIIQDVSEIQALYNSNSTAPQVAYFKRRANLFPGVETKLLGSGFYKELTSLQGHKNTFYANAAFETESTSLIWDYTANLVIPKMLGLNETA